jgi:hypothetical protein
VILGIATASFRLAAGDRPLCRPVTCDAAGLCENKGTRGTRRVGFRTTRTEESDMRFAGSRWGRMFGLVVLLLWPALLPHPANAVAGCIWYTVLGLSGLAYFLSRVQDDAAEAGTGPAGDPSPSANLATSSRVPVGTPGASGQP